MRSDRTPGQLVARLDEEPSLVAEREEALLVVELLLLDLLKIRVAPLR